MKTLVLFNSKGGVGTTTLVYHLAHMLARLGYRTLAMDLDPQANLTSAFFDEDRLEEIWDGGKGSILKSIQPRIDDTGDVIPAAPIEITDNLFVVAGDLGLSRFEDVLASNWSDCFQNDQDALRNTTSFFRIMAMAGSDVDAEIALIDVGPQLGPINRSALLSADYLLVPLGADLFSIQALRNLGPAIHKWRQDWAAIKGVVSTPLEMPSGTVEPIGYVVLQHAVRFDRPSRHVAGWMERIPVVYRESLLGSSPGKVPAPDPSCLAVLRSYRSLMAMAQDVRKPMFDLKPADGAIGSHAALVSTCYKDFEALARRVAEACEL